VQALNKVSVVIGFGAAILLAQSSARVFAAERNWDAVDQNLASLPEDQGEDPANISKEVLPTVEDPMSLKGRKPGRLARLLDRLGIQRIAAPASYRMSVYVFKRPVGLNVDKEFGIVEVDGNLMNVFAVSTARAGKYTIEGDFTLKIGVENQRPYPFHRSSTYANSPMFWGLQVSGAYWLHSTPHYAFLGMPASMGCVRVDFPTAMEIWDTAVNKVGASSHITIYKSGSPEAAAKYNELKTKFNLTDDTVEKSIDEDLADAHAMTSGDYNGNGHWRREVNRVISDYRYGTYPKCGDKDCFTYFHETPNVAGK
jgi:hypothetical protein